MSALGLLNDWLLWIAGLLMSGAAALGVPFIATYKRSKRNERRLIGDDEDPNTEGVLGIVADNNERIDGLERKMESHHREIMEKLEDAQDS